MREAQVDVSVHVIMVQVHISVHVQSMLQVHSTVHVLTSLHVSAFAVSLGELVVNVNVDHEIESELFLFQDKYLSAFSRVILSSQDVR